MKASTIETTIQQLVAERGFSGAVLVADKEGIILHKGYGRANDTDDSPVTAVTVFDIGSISKQFTAAAILHLEAQGKLDVHGRLQIYLPDISPDKTDITLHHLLTHSAGFTTDHFEDDLAPLTKEEALAPINALPLGYAPGTRYEYSNTGYTLLAMVVEAVSGMAFTTYLHEQFFTPLGMTRTGFYQDDWQNTAVAHTYLNGEAQGSPATWPGPFWGVMGNGGILSTVGDLYIWWQSLGNNTILPPTQTEKLFARHISEGAEGSFYGYGWTLQDTPYGRLITHNGGGIGGNSDLAVYTDQGVVVIICSNRMTMIWDAPDSEMPINIWLPATETRLKLAQFMKQS